jgi:hypothetical protein
VTAGRAAVELLAAEWHPRTARDETGVHKARPYEAPVGARLVRARRPIPLPDFPQRPLVPISKGTTGGL